MPNAGPGGGPRGAAAAMAGARGRKIDKGTAKRVLGYIFGKKYRFVLILVLISLVVSALVSVRSALFTKTLIDDYITPLLASSAPDFTALVGAIIQMGVIYLIGIIAAFMQNILMVGVSQGVLKTLRDDMFAKMQRLPVKYFDSHSHGDMMSRFTNDTDTLQQMVSQSIPQVISSAITVVSVFVSMLVLSWQMTLFIVAFVIVMMLATAGIAGKSGSFFVAQQKALGSVNGYIEEMMNGQKVVKVFCHEPQAKSEFDRLNDELRDNAYKANKFANILMPIMNNLGHLQYVMVATLGGLMAIKGMGGMTLGAVASFLTLSKSFTQPITQVSQQLNSVVMAMAGAQRIFAQMDELPETDDGYVTLVNARYDEKGELTETDEPTGLWAWKHPHGDGSLTYTKLTGDIRMVDVDFAYEEGKPVLHDVTLFAEPGQKVAFVGATGAGKTTITNLINRFYDIADGKIRYDGININKIKKNDLRRSLGIVLQDTNLFTGTVMDNIRYGKLDATDEEVYAAARLANADDFIRRLPQGYDTPLTNNGARLSQGQRQLISIARAAVADPPVMILDEATSSIDTRTESLVQKGMDGLMQGRTVFVIAHRLSTVQNSDVIMVLELGHIIERGSHEHLIAEKGKYYQLYTGAFELE